MEDVIIGLSRVAVPTLLLILVAVVIILIQAVKGK
jgi:hypothetical protein